MAEFCVTGGTGFIGAYLVKALLEKGYLVRTTVRDPGQLLLFSPMTASVNLKSSNNYHDSQEGRTQAHPRGGDCTHWTSVRFKDLGQFTAPNLI